MDLLFRLARFAVGAVLCGVAGGLAVAGGFLGALFVLTA